MPWSYQVAGCSFPLYHSLNHSIFVSLRSQTEHPFAEFESFEIAFLENFVNLSEGM